MNTGNRIKQLRTSLGMSQEELGEKIGVQKAAIHKYESGIVINLKRSAIDKLAKALKTTPAYLMGWTSVPSDDSAAGEKEKTSTKGGLSEEEVRLISRLREAPKAVRETIYRAAGVDADQEDD